MSSTTRAVLVVEDDHDLRYLIDQVLSDVGYRVQTASDGYAALDRVALEMPGLILLDMRMPHMNGWEFARLFREQYDHLSPIIVITAAADAAQRASDINADGHLSKPFELPDLIGIVEAYLGPPA